MSDEIEFIKQEISKLPLNKNNHRRYPKAVKSAARELIHQGVGINEICAATGIHPTTLHFWSYPQKKKPKLKSHFKEVPIKTEPKVESGKNLDIHFSGSAQILGLRFSEVVELLKMELIK